MDPSDKQPENDKASSLVPLRARLQAAAQSAATRLSTVLSNLTALWLLTLILMHAFMPAHRVATATGPEQSRNGGAPIVPRDLVQQDLPLDIATKRVATERIVLRPSLAVGPPSLSTHSRANDEAASPPIPDQKPSVQPQPEPGWPAEEIAAAQSRCTSLLATGNVSYEPQQPVRNAACGAPALVKVLTLGKSAVKLAPNIVANCPLAAMLDTWVDKILQPAAQDILGSPVTRLVGTSSYVCRNRNGAAEGPISEHAFANAFDIASFALADGRMIDVRSWTPKSAASEAATRPDAGKPKSKAVAGTEPKVNLGAVSQDDAQAAAKGGSPGPDVVFLKRVHQGACALFGTVLGPDANAAHREHLHFDLKARRGTAYCQ